MKTIYCFVFCLLFIIFNSFSQTPDSTGNHKGWGWGGMPIIAYDSDLGLKYGGLVNLFDYGNGHIYPDYRHSLYAEFSKSTKGSDTYLLKYDSKSTFTKLRITSSLAYFSDQFLDFYGFNGYESNYNSHLMDKKSHQYKSKAFYKQKREMFRSTIDFTGKLYISKLKWLLGSTFYKMNLGSVDINTFNKKSNPEDSLPHPSTTPGVFEQYLSSGLISQEEKNGGTLLNLKTGCVYDSRDNEANPNHGVWSEIMLIGTKVFNASKPYYLQLVVSHRQYFSLLKNKLNFAGRIGFQQKIAGSIPFYMLPILYSSTRPPMNGLGGSMNLRGVLRNRVQGEGMCFANLELRWKALKSKISSKRNIYAALTAFSDLGMITKRYAIENTNLLNTDLISDKTETIHQSVGLGLHLAYNENFIISVYSGHPLNPQDGKWGLYTDVDFLF